MISFIKLMNNNNLCLSVPYNKLLKAFAENQFLNNLIVNEP